MYVYDPQYSSRKQYFFFNKNKQKTIHIQTLKPVYFETGEDLIIVIMHWLFEGPNLYSRVFLPNGNDIKVTYIYTYMNEI